MKLRWPVLTLPFVFIACSGDSTDDAGTPPAACLNISGEVEASGLKIRKPEDETHGCVEMPGSNEEEKLCGEKEPELGCLGQNDPLGTPINVIYTGCVNSFGLEAASDDLTVTVMRESVGATRTDPGYDLNGATGAQAEKTPAAQIGRTLSTRVERTECFDFGHFELANVPTETPLIVRVTDQHIDREHRGYVDTYQYNLVLRNTALRMGPTPTSPLVTDPATYCAANMCYAVDDVNTVYEVTFGTVATTAGVTNIMGSDDLYDGVGQGHLAGEVQDCSSKDTLQNAVIALDVKARKTAYFNVGYGAGVYNLENPRVDQSRTRTNADGLYAAIALDTPPGGIETHVGAAITTSVCGDDGVCKCVDGKANPLWTAADANEANTVVLGDRRIYVYPDSITILTFDSFTYTTHN